MVGTVVGGGGVDGVSVVLVFFDNYHLHVVVADTNYHCEHYVLLGSDNVFHYYRYIDYDVHVLVYTIGDDDRHELSVVVHRL